jgi:hypothetical protein
MPAAPCFFCAEIDSQQKTPQRAIVAALNYF